MTTRIQARGATLREAFAETALAVLGQAWSPGSIEEREVREVRAHGETLETLLANWINECLYVHEVEAFACRRIDFAVFDVEPRPGGEPMRLHSYLHGDEIDASGPRPRALAELSASSVRLRAVDGGYEVAVTGEDLEE